MNNDARNLHGNGGYKSSQLFKPTILHSLDQKEKQNVCCQHLFSLTRMGVSNNRLARTSVLDFRSNMGYISAPNEMLNYISVP